MLLTPRSIVTNTGDALTLTPENDLWVKAGVRIWSGAERGIFAQSGGAYTIRVEGQVMGASGNGIEIDDVSFQQKHVVTIGATGRVAAPDLYAISVYGKALSLTNNGILEGAYGVYFYSGVATSQAVIANRGTIVAADYAIENGSGGTFVLFNTGRVISYGAGSYQGDDGRDRVVNSGLMVGSVSLGGGVDLYEGRGGRVVGLVDGGSGDDRFLLGAAAEKIYGDVGFDTVVFTGRIGVRLALDGGFANTGTAKGDTYLGIERFVGTAFADVLRGDALNNALAGGGGADYLIGLAGSDDLQGGDGNDRLYGGADQDQFKGGTGNDLLQGDAGNDSLNGESGNDRILGGLGDDFLLSSAGRDTVTGGDGADDFALLFTKGDIADQITDFAPGVDQVHIMLASFGLSAAPSGNWFLASATNRAAEAANRLLYRTTDHTLWWDADGNGRAAPVHLATFTNRAVLTATDFLFTDL